MKHVLWLALILTACSQPSGPHLDVESSVEANLKAKGHIEWETSDQHPTQIFEKWNSTPTSPALICEALLKRTGIELTIFEEEFRNPKNQALIAPCTGELKKKLNDYWESLNEYRAISVPPKFAPIEETRDFSGGYFAYTADLKPGQVLLTFDDGPHPQYTGEILKILAEANVHGIFFQMGNNVRSFPEETKKIAAAGHGVGSHSMSHRCLPFSRVCEKNGTNKGHRLRYSEAIAEIVGGHTAVRNVLGWVDPYFRFPYGESSDELRKFLMDRAMGDFAWNMDSEDWRMAPQEQIVPRVMRQLKEKKRGIILFHDVEHKTPRILADMLREIYFGGYQIVFIKPKDPKARYESQLLKRPTATAEEIRSVGNQLPPIVTSNAPIAPATVRPASSSAIKASDETTLDPAQTKAGTPQTITQIPRKNVSKD